MTKHFLFLSGDHLRFQYEAGDQAAVLLLTDSNVQTRYHPEANEDGSLADPIVHVYESTDPDDSLDDVLAKMAADEATRLEGLAGLEV